jgi:hypothetical protein
VTDRGQVGQERSPVWLARSHATWFAAGSGIVGVLVLAVRDSGSQPGRTGLAALVLIGTLVFVLPFAVAVHLLTRASSRRALPAIVVSACACLFLATRGHGGFVQVWFVFTLAAGVVILLLITELDRSWMLRRDRSPRHSRRS